MDSSPKLPSEPSSGISGYIQKADELINSAEAIQAITLLDEAIIKHPKNEELLIRLAQANNLVKRGKAAEQITKKIKTIFPQSKHFLNLMGESFISQGKYRRAAKYFKRSIEEDPSNIASFINYTKLVALLETNNQDVVIEVMERFKATHYYDVSPYYIYSEFCLNVIHDTNKARKIINEGLRLHPDNNVLLTSLLYVESIEGNQKEVLRLKAKMETLGIESLIHIETQIEKNTLHYRSLRSFIPSEKKSSPQIIDAEQHSFPYLKSTTEPVVALYAYAHPRPNLDIMYHFYKLLKARGKTVLLFLKNEHLHDFDLSDIDCTADYIFYGVWTEFFYAADFINCIITNDICQINPLFLPEQTKLVFHAPHGTAMPTIYRQNLISHYSTFLNPADLPDISKILRFDWTPEKVCLIPNSYTKNEYLLSFIKHIKSPIKIISFCPTTFVVLERILKLTDNYELSLENYLKHTIEMVNDVMEAFPEHYFLYRPFWGHSNHLCLTTTLLEKFRNNNYFLVDDYSNSKHTLAMSEILITDISGLGITFSEMKQMKHIRYSSMNIIEDHNDSADEDSYLACHSPNDVVMAISAILNSPHNTEDNGQIKNSSPGLRESYCGARYLADNIDYILDGKKNNDWYYFNMSDLPMTDWNGVKNI